MQENQTYFYMRLKENFFDSNELVVLESLPDGYLFSNILLKLYLRSLRDEGRLMFNNAIPFNAEMIATITRHKVETVEQAMDTFQRMGLIEILDSGAIYMLNIQNYIGKASTAADRQREYYNRIANEKSGKAEALETSAKKPGKKSCKKPYKGSAPEAEKKAEAEKAPESGGNISFLLPTSDGKPFTIYRAQVENLSRRFPTIDVESELGNLRHWLCQNPKRQKPRSGTNEIMQRWLSEAQEKAKREDQRSFYEDFDKGLDLPENL